MKRRRLYHLLRGAAFGVCTLSLLGLFAAPAQAGTVYVPLTIDGEAGGIGVRTDVWIANTTNKAIEFTSYFIPSLQDGTDRPAKKGDSIQVAARGTLRFEGIAPAGKVGVMELDLPDGVVATARLVTIHPQLGEMLGAEMPVLSAETLIPAGSTAHVQGWEREVDHVLTDFGTVNLSATPAQCQVSVFRGNGQKIGGTATFPVQPLSSVHFPSALGILGQSDVPIARSQVSCDQDFYPYAVVTDIETGEAVFHGPSARGEDGLSLPGDDPGVGGGECPQNAFCFSKSGTFFLPTVKDDYRRENFSVPAGNYSSLHLSVEVVNGGWAQPTSGLNLMFWLARNGRHFNLYGFAGFKGPNRNTVLFRHGIGMVAGDKPKFESNFASQIGQTYIFDYTYNPGEGYLDLKILDKSGKVLWRATDKPNVKTIVIPEGEVITADFSNRLGANPAEPPSYGWQYRNLQFEIFK